MTTWTPTPLAADASGTNAPDAILRTLRDVIQGRELGHPFTGKKVGDYASRVSVGWLEQSRDVRYPTIGLDLPGTGTRSPRQALELYTIGTPAPSDVIVSYVVVTAVLEQPVDVNLYADSPEKRAEIAYVFELALKGNPLIGSSLCVPSRFYFGLPVGFRQLGTFRYLDTASAVGGDEFRAYVQVEATIPEAFVIRGPRIRSLNVLSNLIELRGEYRGPNQETWSIVSP